MTVYQKKPCVNSSGVKPAIQVFLVGIPAKNQPEGYALWERAVVKPNLKSWLVKRKAGEEWFYLIFTVLKTSIGGE